MNGTLTTAGASSAVSLQPGQSLTWTLSVAEGESFVGNVLVQSSDTQQAWKTLASYAGTALVALQGAVGSGTVTNETPNALFYQVAAYDFGEGSDGVAYDLTELTNEVLKHWQNPAGTTVLDITDEGIETPKAAIGGTINIGGKAATDVLLYRRGSGLGLGVRKGDDSGFGDITVDKLILASSAVPATADATGVAHTMLHDADYIYVCTAANTWKRVAIATWS